VYREAFSRAETVIAARQRLLAEERRQADELIDRFNGVSDSQQDLMIGNSRAFKTWGLAERLIEECRREIDRLDYRQADRHARAAVRVTEALATTLYGSNRCRELRATARANRGNTYRVAGNFAAAHRELRSARRILGFGTGDDEATRAEIASLETSLLLARGDWPGALNLVDRTLTELPAGCEPLRCDLLIKKAAAQAQLQPQAATTVYLEALAAAAELGSGQRTFCARQGYVLTLCQTGRSRAASRQLDLIHRTHHGSLHRGNFHLRWAEGRVALGLGDRASAREILGGVWRSLVDNPCSFHCATLVALDLLTAERMANGSVAARRLGEYIQHELVILEQPTASLKAWGEAFRLLLAGPLSPPSTEAFRRFLWRAWSDPRAELGL